MKNLIHTAVVTLFATSAAHAQQAVQWKVSDGGNGHWYLVSAPENRTWQSWHDLVTAFGGHLATVTSAAERDFIQPSVRNMIPLNRGAVLGARQDRNDPTWSEPSGGWQWVTGEPWSWTNWTTFVANPSNSSSGECSCEDHLSLGRWAVTEDGVGNWNDYNGNLTVEAGAIIEWSADCNSDGIVDYGQCYDGTLPDYNGNNVPDCCERGEACVVGNYPVQWRIEDGGNGHWYQLRTQGLTIAWQSADAVAKADGGYLASILSEDEDIFVFRLSDTPGAWQGPLGPWLGGAQIPGSGEPVGTWIWLSSGDPWTYAGPNSDFADNGSRVDENRLHYVDHARRWNDIAEDGFPEYFGGIRSLLIEWSADCNNDGVVDYGQILQGQLADNDVDGIPDVCEQPTCVDADIYRDFNVNGADLGILLSQWGPNTPLTESDINNDGVVNGADLGLLLSFWGPCPN